MRRPSRGLICNYVCHMQEFKRAASIHSTERKNCIWFCCCSRLLSLAFTVFVCSRSFVFIQSNPFVMFSTFILTQHFSSPRRTQKKTHELIAYNKNSQFSLSVLLVIFFLCSRRPIHHFSGFALAPKTVLNMTFFPPVRLCIVCCWNCESCFKNTSFFRSLFSLFHFTRICSVETATLFFPLDFFIAQCNFIVDLIAHNWYCCCCCY